MPSVSQSGRRVVRERWWIVAVLFLAQICAGLGFGALSWSWLSDALHDSVVTRTLLTDLDANVFVDLWHHEAASLHMMLQQGAMLALLAMAIFVWLNGAAIAAVVGAATLRDSLRTSLETIGPLFMIGIVVTLADAVVVGVVVGVAKALAGWMADTSSEATSAWIWGSATVTATVSIWLVSALHDHARIRCFAAEGSSLRSLSWALAFLARRDPAALRVNLAFAAVGLIVWAVYQVIAAMVPVGTMTAVVVLLIWGQLFMLARVALRVWLFATEAAVQLVHEAGE